MRIVLLLSLAIWWSSAAPAGAQESFELTCPPLSRPLVMRDPVPVPSLSADRALNKGWRVRAVVGLSLVPIWQKMTVLPPPRFDGVILECEALVQNVRFTASVGLLRISCKADEKRRVFHCKKY